MQYLPTVEKPLSQVHFPLSQVCPSDTQFVFTSHGSPFRFIIWVFDTSVIGSRNNNKNKNKNKKLNNQ
jgi:hypothetical protein